ncbi:terminase [Mycolicibacterium sp. P9-64]|nr:terminase [Mycolicibacterium sp. P9-64]
MSTGPKRRVSAEPLPFAGTGTPSERFAQWCLKYLVVSKGKGANGPVRLRDWQVALMASLMDPSPRPSIAGVMMPRGSGKTMLMACWALFELFEGPFGNQLVVVAVDERQSRLTFETAAAMVGLSEELLSRCQVFRERLEVPGKGSTFTALPAEAKRLEGLGNFSLAIADEIGVIARETWETLLLGLGKVDNATVVGIGTPSVSSDSVLLDLRAYGQDHPEDASFVWREFSADEFTATHAVDCQHCWALACPALGDFSSEAAMRALLPPKTTEGAFRRARLCQFVSENVNPFIDEATWLSLSTGLPIPDGTDVVLALDGSFSDDTTALLLSTVSAVPHFAPLQVWAQPSDQPDWRVPVLEVEQAIRDACKQWRVKEVVADPFRWNRTLQVLGSEGLPVVEFPHSPSRLTRATTDAYSAAVNANMTHSGDATMTNHVMAATVIESDGGLRLGKTSRKRSAQKIDLAACLVMAHSRATWLAAHPKKRNRAVSFA